MIWKVSHCRHDLDKRELDILITSGEIAKFEHRFTSYLVPVLSFWLAVRLHRV